jgi:hypothetical protein
MHTLMHYYFDLLAIETLILGVIELMQAMRFQLWRLHAETS